MAAKVSNISIYILTTYLINDNSALIKTDRCLNMKHFLKNERYEYILPFFISKQNSSFFIST